MPHVTAIRSGTWGPKGLGRFESEDWTTDPYRRVTSWLVHGAVVLVGFDFSVRSGVSVGLLIALVTIPMWISLIRHYQLAPLIVGLSMLAIVSGLVLAKLAESDHVVSANNRTTFVGVLLSGIAGMVILLWAREIMPLHRVVLLYGVGALADGFLFGEMSWKFNLATPTILVALGIAERYKSRLIPAVVITVLGGFAVLDEGRSLFGFCLLAATLTVWQMRPAPVAGTKSSRWFPALLMAGLALSLYFIGTSLLTSGALGVDLQARSVAQVDASGSLIAGGRPEWAATRELVKMRPEGYGLGVVPSWTDLQAGTDGLARINIDAGGYTRNYMFGGQFNLHSITSDLWASYGWVGVALALTVLFAIVRSMSFLIAARRAPTSVLFACIGALWYLFFGPIYSNWLEVCLALGLALLVRAPQGDEDDGPATLAAEPLD